MTVIKGRQKKMVWIIIFSSRKGVEGEKSNPKAYREFDALQTNGHTNFDMILSCCNKHKQKRPMQTIEKPRDTQYDDIWVKFHQHAHLQNSLFPFPLLFIRD